MTGEGPCVPRGKGGTFRELLSELTLSMLPQNKYYFDQYFGKVDASSISMKTSEDDAAII